jgi:hypothetical protein
MVVTSPQRPVSADEVLAVSRTERLICRLERSGVPGRAVAGALHSSVIAARWA